jgi:hypothetical protein
MSLPLRANTLGYRIRSPQPVSQHVRTMINMLKIPQHGIETITTHMNIVTSPKKI